MVIRQDNSVQVTLPSVEQFSTPAEIRDFLLRQWIIETPQTKYMYIAETLSTGEKLYLKRPANLNKGCDFAINVENLITFKNGNDKPPSHSFLIDDLTVKKASLTSQQWNSALKAIKVIFNAGALTNAQSMLTGVPCTGHSYEVILLLTRWFFIEQDITYWAGIGRKMLHDGILKI
jgi:hypothetical protein